MNRVPESFKLTQHEVQSALWIRIAEEINRRIATLRANNDGNLNELDTAKLRGRIAELKSLLAMAESRRRAERVAGE